MKISELMEILGEIQGQHGDVSVYLDEYDNMDKPLSVNDAVVQVAQAKTDEGTPIVLISNYKMYGDT